MEFTIFNQLVNAAELDPRARAKAGRTRDCGARVSLVSLMRRTVGEWFPRQCRLGHFFCRAPGVPNTRGGRCNASRRPLSRRPRV